MFGERCQRSRQQQKNVLKCFLSDSFERTSTSLPFVNSDPNVIQVYLQLPSSKNWKDTREYSLLEYERLDENS